MRLATVKVNETEQAAIVYEQAVILIKDINRVEKKSWETNVFTILQKEQLNEINQWYKRVDEQKILDLALAEAKSIEYMPLYRQPKKIFGIGMNYMEKVRDFNASPTETEPVSFLKPDSSLIGLEEPIKLPIQSAVSGEGELGIIIGKTCRNIEEHEVPEVVAGFTNTLDMTAKDIHARNPRFLQVSKIFDTFFSFGPHLITFDEIPNLEDVSVSTVLNGESIHTNTIRNMMFPPWLIVSYFSKIVTLSPGDIIMTGTPGSVLLSDGDIVECKINDFPSLRNPVIKEV
ncbi:fumarylacetoacetate hydrolase family protein [Peribacillus frigoritolerans]|uniref:fumarylacetoacetate hydrolase family protein n=1 Tax=Peribacillus frigoritolerans TaxID=450367 RepID=UPI003F813148